MGLFDYVNVAMPCPKCGTELDDFQSKDRGCDMEKIDPDAVIRFYTHCSQCSAWVEFRRAAVAHEIRSAPYTRDEVEAMGFTYIKE